MPVIGNSLIHNMMAMNGARNLGIVTGNQKKNTEKLSSGYRVNRAADDAAGLAISEKMRRQIRGLDQTVRNINEGKALCNVADGALNEINSMLNRQEELLVQAANDTNTYEDREYIQAELKQLADEMDRSFDITTYNEIELFKGKDTILDDPARQTIHTVTERTETDPTATTVTKDVINAVDLPADTVEETVNITSGGRTSSYNEWEQVHDTDEKGHTSYEVHHEYTVTEGPETTTKTKVTKTYKKLDPDPKAKALVSPKQMTGAKGYINVKNELGWPLSCAMSQLGVKVGDSTIYDLYNMGNVSSVNYSDDGNIVEHTYDLGSGLSFTQKIELLNGDTYKLSYSMKNTGAEDKTASARLAFDTMNTNGSSTTATRANPPYVLKSDFASISISTSGADESVLGTIDNLYNTWGSEGVTAGAAVTHSGVGAWWNDRNVPAGGSIELGSVTYGPITVADQYERTTKTEVDVTRKYTDTKDDDMYAYLPKYLDIHVGTEKDQVLPIRLWELNSDTLRCRVPQEISAHAAGDSIQYLKHALLKVSGIRSYYGATTNRLEHAARNNANVSENTSAAESRIRDTDMALEMVSFSNNSVLMQAGTSILAQANSSPQSVLQLLA